MALTDRVQQILSWYSSENPGTLTNLVRLLNHGKLAGTGAHSYSEGDATGGSEEAARYEMPNPVPAQ